MMIAMFMMWNVLGKYTKNPPVPPLEWKETGDGVL